MSTVQTYQALRIAAPSALEPFRGLNSLTQQIFDAALLPILVMRFDDGTLIYTNPAARSALGLPVDGVVTVWDLLLDEADREIFRQQLQKRKQGHNDDYEITYCRLDNKRRIAVRIAGIALHDEDGGLFASLAIVRLVHVSRATEAILKATQSAKGWREVFSALARQLVKVLPFDEFNVALVDEKSLLSKVIFRCGRAIQPVPIRQKWYTLTAEALDRLQGDPLIVPNIRDYLVEVGLADLIEQSSSGLSRGLRSFMSVPMEFSTTNIRMAARRSQGGSIPARAPG